MKHRIKYAAILASTGLAAVASPAYAVPYASGVRNTGGASWEFVLNESADVVTIVRDGGNEVTIPTPGAGRHSFDMTGFTNFEIKVAKDAPVAWTKISDPTNLFSRFERPNDIAVNTIPSSPYFGTVYVLNPRTTAVTVGGVNRPMGDGVYALTSDLIGVNLPTGAALTDPNDVSAAKAPSGWNVTDSGANSAYRIGFDAAGNLLVSDFSDANGGIKYATADLTTGGSLLLHQDGVRPLLTNGSGQEIHGSIVSTPYATGTLFNNLTVYAVDEDMNPAAPSAAGAGPGNSLWRWNVGSATEYDQPPQLIVDAGKVPRTTDATPRENWMSTNAGVNTEAVFSPVHNKWYISTNRSDGNQAGLLVVTPDGVDGATPTLNWSSLQWTIDNGLDGHITVANTADGHGQDVFRMIMNITLSPDGTKLYASRNAQLATTNPALSTSAPGAILEIPLDANGIPQLTVEAGAITNVRTITVANNTSNSAVRPVTVDAAGNVYTGNNNGELIEVFSPGGNWIATTTSAGTFSLTAGGGGGLAGDFNGDNTVDGADFLAWQRGQSPNNGSAADLDLWKTNFGTSAAAPAAAAVPEPASIAGLATGLLGLLTFRRRRNGSSS
jgi:hypothetical protein